MTLSHQQKIAACVLICYWPALFVLTHVPIPDVIQKADVSDKSLHFLAYLILTLLLWSVVSGDKKVKWTRASPWLVLLVIVVYGILDERLQNYVAGRSCDVRDFFSDLAGALTGLIISSFLTFWPASLLVVATFIFSVTNITRTNLADRLPLTVAVFHLFAYAILTILWIHCMYIFRTAEAHKAKWFISAIAGPAGYLIIVKLFSITAGKDLVFSEIIISFVAIVVVVAVSYSRASLHKTKDSKSENGRL